MDIDLIFYYWILNERYLEELYLLFDDRLDVDDDEDVCIYFLWFYRLRVN